MEKNILFCNIAWMKNYTGDYDDKPVNGGGYIEEEGTGGEIYNFLDNNGKCYGYVMVGGNGNMALQKYYKGVKSTDEYVDDILVVWVATNEKSKPKIVGWYKNARVYRSFQKTTSFTYQDVDLYYNIVAEAIDCYLLPEDNRTITIDRANEVGKGMGMGQSNIWYADSVYAKANIIPRVIQYIDTYNDGYSNFIYDDWDIEKEINDISVLKEFQNLFEEGLKEFNLGNYYDSLVYFKAAQMIDESIELLNKIGENLFFINQYDQAIELFNKVIKLEGETINSLLFLMGSYDRKSDMERTMEYANKLVTLTSNNPKEIEDIILAYEVLFNIYIYQYKFQLAEETISKLNNFLINNSDYSKDDINNTVNPMKDFLNKRTKNLVI